jgi:hypothetical protein
MIEVVDEIRAAEERLAAFRERVFNAVHESIDYATVPLFVEADGKAIDYRSGVLLQIGDFKFLVTAGHYLPEYCDKGHAVCLVMPDKGKAPIKLVSELFWSTKSGSEDLSVARLTEPILDYMGDHYRFIRIPQMMSRFDKQQGEGFYLIYGFPTALKGPDDTGATKVESWKYLTVPFSGSYADVEDYQPNLHVVLAYERKSYSREGEKVHPPGMSGCGIWYVGAPISHALFNKDDFRLVGIQNCWHKGVQYAKGTWIDSVLLIIWKYFSDTRDVMRLHGIDF